MVLEKIEKKNILQRFIKLILGKEKPNFLTRVSVLAGFIVWIYLISWHVLTLLAITLMDTVYNSSYIRATFTTVGKVKYGLADPITQLLIHSIAQLVIFVVILLGLIFIWRRKRIGFFLFIFGYVGSLLASFVIMQSFDYLINEISLFDYLLILGSILYFVIGLLMFTKWKGPEKTETTAATT